MKSQGGLIFLKEILSDLPEGEKRIATYILKNPERVLDLNITELAKSCGGSAAGVVRLCKRLSVGGYRELQLRITSDIYSKKQAADETFHLVQGLSAKEIIRSVIHNNRKAMDEILSMIDEDAMKKAADVIMKAGRIEIFGVGASGMVALDLYQKLQRLGINSSYNFDSHLQITASCGLTAKDAAVAISYSGETAEVLKATQEAKKSKALVISLTRFGQTPISELVDIKLFIPSTEPLVREGAMASRIAQLTVVDILFSIIVSRNTKSAFSHLERTLEAVHSIGR